MPDDAPPPTPPLSGAEARKRRYSPSPDAARPVTTRQRQALGLVAELQPLGTSHVRRMLDLNPKAALRTLRALFDAGLVEKLAVPRAVMAETPEAAACRGLYEDLYRLTREGARLLGRPTPRPWSRGDWLFLPHEVLVRDVAGHFMVSARHHGLAAPTLRVEETRLRSARPDAWLALPLGERTLFAFVEADRGTERGERHWADKARTYADLFASGELLTLTGFARVRVLVVAPDWRRCEVLSELVERQAPHDHWLYWLTPRTTLDQDDFSAGRWLNAGAIKPLISPNILSNSQGNSEDNSRPLPQDVSFF